MNPKLGGLVVVESAVGVTERACAFVAGVGSAVAGVSDRAFASAVVVGSTVIEASLLVAASSEMPRSS